VAQQPVQQPMQPQQPLPLATNIPDADAWMNDSVGAADAHFNSRIAGVQKDILAPQLAGIYKANAQTARALAFQQHGNAFTRWGPEIDMQMQAIPVEQRSFEMYTEAVKLVKGAHADQITQEALDKGVANEIDRRLAAGTIRSGGSPTGATLPESLDFNSENLGERWGHLATETTIEGQMEFLRKAYPDDTLAEARKKYLALLAKGNAVQAEANS